ncbi:MULTISPECIES: hypothetical protein [Vibrio]|uniref:hypothetical protein n=1 Tax=Vibrio TaxID=662 RepID=UPI0015DDC53C|nr:MULTISPECIES: hypothetical protein [Vibrio]EJE8154267.1 hypothetical protein [Vibrio alginolyticus]MBE5194978.1 hypothetical protein [Vibrio parahaemolyticus]MBS9975554.1 hypothetical protein [Vibrio alginolyticus]MBT0021372.1 hypothetical protein [Vibrio alginolyticus]MCI9719614.1 hypothetical protein [Vibrio parahaemolyticus]
MKKVDNQALFKHVEKVNAKVSQWPQWQQQLINQRVPETKKAKSQLKPSHS